MNTTLTDRYIDAATRSIPERQRPDITAELRERIADEIDGRLAEGQATDAAERAVLTELGDPDKLAAEYLDRPLHLIGPRYYLAWWRLLKLLWAIVPACAAFGVALGTTLAGESIGHIIATTWSVAFTVAVQIGFWTTLVFFIVERSAAGKDVGFVGEWTIDRLPEPRESGAKLSDLVWALVWLSIAAGAVVWDHFVGVVYLAGGGGWMPFLSPELWPWWITGLFVVLAAEGALMIAVYARGWYTWTLAAVNLALNLVLAIPTVWLLATGSLLNPEFFPTLIGDGGADVAGIVSIVFGFVFAGVAVWDSIDGFLKARRASRP